MAEFRSSARSIGFNAINVPDNARRIQEDGEKKVRDLRRVYEETIRQKRQFAEDKRISNALVREQVKANQQLDSDFKQSYKQQLRTRQQQELDKLKKQQELDQDVYERLGTFSQGALKLGKELMENRKEERQAYGLALVMEYGVTAEELEQLQKKENLIEREGAANNAVVERLKAQGASPAEIKRIRDLNGWALYGAQKGIAMSAKNNWYAFTQNPERRNKKYKVGDQMMSLQQAEDAGLASQRANIYAQMKAEFLKPYAGYDSAFAEKYLFPGMREVDTANLVSFNSDLRKQNEEDERNNRINDISTRLLDPNASKRGYESIIQLQARDGGPLAGFAREQVLRDLIYMVENRYQLTPDQVDQIATQEFTINGKTVTFADQYLTKGGKATTTYELYTELQRKVADKDLENFTRKRQLRQAKALQFETNFIQLVDGPVNIATTQAVRKKFKEDFPGIEMSSQMVRVLTNQASGLEADIEYRMALADNNLQTYADVVTKYEKLSSEQLELVLRKNNIDPKTKTKLSEDIIEDNRGQIRNILSTRINAADTKANQYKVDGVLDAVMDRWVKDVMIEMRKNPLITYKEAANNITAKYAKEFGKVDPEDPFFKVTGEGNNATFAGIDPLNTSYATEQAEIIKAVSDDPESLFNKPLLGKPGSPLVNDMLLMGDDKVPRDWILSLSSQLGYSWKTIYNLQAPRYGLDPIELTRDEEAQELIDPRVRGLLGNRPSPATLQEATSGQQRLIGATGLEVYRPILNLIASEESSNDVEGKGYDAMNLGGTDGGRTPIGTTTGSEQFGKPLTEYTLGEIYEMQKNGQLHAAGRYQFIELTMYDMIEARGLLPPGVTLDSKFDAQTQDILAITYFRQTIQDYKNSNQDPVYGLGQRWIGLQNVNQEELERIVNQIRNDPRYQTPGFQAYEVSPEYEAARQLKYGVA